MTTPTEPTDETLRAMCRAWAECPDSGAAAFRPVFEVVQAALASEREAVDAARYRWLRMQPNDTSAPRIEVVSWTTVDESANEGEGLRLDALDAAIDAVIRARSAKSRDTQ